VEPGKKQRKKENGSQQGKKRTANYLHSICNTQPFHREQDSIFLTKLPFSLFCVMPWDRIFDCWHNSSSRSVAARISPVK